MAGSSSGCSWPADHAFARGPRRSRSAPSPRPGRRRRSAGAGPALCRCDAELSAAPPMKATLASTATRSTRDSRFRSASGAPPAIIATSSRYCRPCAIVMPPTAAYGEPKKKAGTKNAAGQVRHADTGRALRPRPPRERGDPCDGADGEDEPGNQEDQVPGGRERRAWVSESHAEQGRPCDQRGRPRPAGYQQGSSLGWAYLRGAPRRGGERGHPEILLLVVVQLPAEIRQQ